MDGVLFGEPVTSLGEQCFISRTQQRGYPHNTYTLLVSSFLSRPPLVNSFFEYY